MGAIERVIRPAAVLPADAAVRIIQLLSRQDVSRGGLWNATVSVWQRYDRPWDGPLGSRGRAKLIGSIAVVFDQPLRDEVTVYKATVTEHGVRLGWDIDRICNEALTPVGYTLANCPRAALVPPPPPDPFHFPQPRSSADDRSLTR